MYTIIVVTYNSEKYILEALESVRYQVEKYGAGRTYQLILADDCSQDRTKEYEEKWLKKNQHLFEVVTKIYQKENKGTCKNFADALRSIEGELFFAIAGDDMFSFNDVFSILQKTPDWDVLAAPPLVVIREQLSSELKYYVDALAASSFSQTYIKWAVGLGNPIISGAAWKKELNTQAVLEYQEQFRVLDDRARFYAIWHTNKLVQFKFVNKSLILYRRNDDSVSSKSSGHLNVINDDLIQFFNMSAANSNSILYKFCAKAQAFSARLRGNRRVEIIRYFTPYYLIEEVRRLINYRELKNRHFELMSREYKRGQKYFHHIQKKAQSFRSGIDE